MSLQGTANGNVPSDDGVNNNNLEISIVKCRISNSAARDATNDLTNANQLQTDNKLEKLIAEIDNINFDEVANSARSQCVPSRRAAVAFTQGDYLNEIKMNRKKNSAACNGKSLPIPSNGSIINRPNTRLYAACSSSTPRVVKLDPNKYSLMSR